MSPSSDNHALPPETATPTSDTAAANDALAQALMGEMSPERKAKMEAISEAIDLLTEAKVSHLLFASSQGITPQMGFLPAQHISYAEDAAIRDQETMTGRISLLAIALQNLSIGFLGSIAVLNRNNQPISVFQNGQVRHLSPERPRVSAKAVDRVLASVTNTESKGPVTP